MRAKTAKGCASLIPRKGIETFFCLVLDRAVSELRKPYSLKGDAPSLMVFFFRLFFLKINLVTKFSGV
jgi:hypothetical protein